MTEPTPNHKLRYERERRAWSQQEVADKVGTTPLNVSRWERGITHPSPYFRQRLYEIFEKSAQELGLMPESVQDGKPIELSSQGTINLTSTAPVIPSAQEAVVSFWNVPYNRNLFFTGREDILAQLRDAFLNGEQPVALAQPQAISGLGGIGKTQTAVEYAYRYRENYDAVLWARADSPDLLISDFLLIAALLNLPQHKEQDQSVVVKAVLRWFDTHEKWLLILDNADYLEMIKGFIPAGKGHVLLTTRAHSTGTVAQRIEIEKMSQEEGVAFLLRRMKRLKGNTELETIPELVRSQAQAIVEAVDGLPLALDQAGAYIEETGCSLTDYLKFFKTRRNRLLRMRGRDATGHPEPVATTWSLSFEKVESANPAAAELLRLCAFLHPDEIPESMIIEGASELGSPLQSIVEDELDWNEAIGELRKYSLVKRDPELKILNIHRLVQGVLKDAMDKEIQREWAERTVRMVNRAFPDPREAAFWSKCQQYLPHVQMCVELIEQWKMVSVEAAQLLSHLGTYFLERDHYTEAERYMLSALTILEQAVGPDSTPIAEVFNGLGLLYSLQGKYQQSESFFLRAIAIQEQAMDGNLSDLADMLSNLGTLYNHQGRYTQAETLLQRALAIWERILRPDDPLIAAGMGYLAWLYDDLGKYTEAETLYKRALAIREQSLGLEHIEVGSNLNNLAVLYRGMGRYEEAEPLLKRTLAIVEKNLGMENPRRATTLSNLAQNYRDKKEYDQATLYFQQALALRQKVLGPEHPDTAHSIHGLAVLYRLQCKYEQAESLFREALTLREKILGLNHPDVASTLNELALLYYEQGKYDQGEPLFQRALSIREQSLGSEHPLVATTLENYSDLLRKMGRDTEAEILAARAHSMQAKQKQ